MSKAGYGAEDFGQGGFTRGRLKVSQARCEIPKTKGGGGGGIMVILHGRDASGAQQDVWLPLGGDAKESNEKFKAGGNGKWIEFRKPGITIGSGSKYGLWMASLRKIGFPMSRFEENDLAAMDGCTFDIDSAVMELSPQILQRIEREGKRVPTYYFATAYELPGAKGSAKDEDVDGDEDDDDDEDGDAGGASAGEAEIDKLIANAGKKVEFRPVKVGPMPVTWYFAVTMPADSRSATSRARSASRSGAM